MKQILTILITILLFSSCNIKSEVKPFSNYQITYFDNSVETLYHITPGLYPFRLVEGCTQYYTDSISDYKSVCYVKSIKLIK